MINLLNINFHYLKFFKIFLIGILLVLISSCAADEGELSDEDLKACTDIAEVFRAEQNTDYKVIGIDVNGTRVGIISWIVDNIGSIITSATSNMFQSISEDDEYRAIIGICITLAIMFYSGSIMLGLAQLSPYSGFMFLLKVICVYNFAVNWDDFLFYVVETIEAFISDAVSLASKTFTGFDGFSESDVGLSVTRITVIGEMDKMLSILWDFRMFKIVLALAFTGLTGAFWAVALFAFIIMYFLAVLEIIKIYLLAFIGRYVLYALGPIFLTFLLFNQTKSLFNGWMKMLISFALQPVFLFIFVGLFMSVIASFMNSIYIEDLRTPINLVQGQGGTTSGASLTIPANACVKYEVLDDTPFGKVNWWRICTKTSETVVDCKTDDWLKSAIDLDIWMLLASVIICYMMFSLTSWVVGVADNLAGGAMALSNTQLQGIPQIKSAVTGGISQGFKGMMQNMGKAPRGGGGS